MKSLWSLYKVTIPGVALWRHPQARNAEISRTSTCYDFVILT